MQPTKRIQIRTLGRIFGLLFLTTLLCAYPVPSRAVGIGPYVDVAGGSGTFEWDVSNSEFDVDVGTGAIGLAIDTAPTGRSGFNYRLNIGLEAQALEDDSDITMNLGGLTVENVFGFAVIQQPNLRWWLGPLVRIGYYSGETDDYYDFGDRYKTEGDFFEFGIGVATGINVRVNRNVVLAPSAGVRFIGASGEGTIINYTTGTRETEDLTGSISTVFLNFALLFE